MNGLEIRREEARRHQQASKARKTSQWRYQAFVSWPHHGHVALAASTYKAWPAPFDVGGLTF